MSLIDNISQIKGISSINVSNKLESWQPYIDEAEETFIRPILGDTLMDALIAHLTSSASGESNFDTLLEKVRRPLALYALWLGIDEMSVQLTASGVQVVETVNNKPAPRYMVVNLKERLISRAHSNVDLLLYYLVKNADSFSSWTNSERDYLIANAAEFSKHVDIRGSRRVFLCLKPVIGNIEKKYIKATLGEDLYKTLKEAYTGSGDDVSDDLKALLELIRPAIAHLSMARALQELPVELLDWGIFETGNSSFDNIVSKQHANQERVSAMIEANQADGDAEIKDLQKFLDNNASESKYVDYFNSDLYQGPDYAEKKNQFVNSSDKKIFVV